MPPSTNVTVTDDHRHIDDNNDNHQQEKLPQLHIEYMTNEFLSVARSPLLEENNTIVNDSGKKVGARRRKSVVGKQHASSFENNNDDDATSWAQFDAAFQDHDRELTNDNNEEESMQKCHKSNKRKQNTPSCTPKAVNVNEVPSASGKTKR
jgi:hypothetical protein